MVNEDLINEIIQCAESEEGQRLADETLARLKNGEVTSDKLVVDLKREDIKKSAESILYCRALLRAFPVLAVS